LYQLKIKIEGVEKVDEEDDDGEDPGEEEIGGGGFDGLEDEEEARQLMETDKNNRSQNMRFGAIVSPIPGHRTVSAVAAAGKTWKLMMKGLSSTLMSVKAGMARWLRMTGVLIQSVYALCPSKIDHSKNDDLVWDFEIPCVAPSTHQNKLLSISDQLIEKEMPQSQVMF
jgi:hypothetical protein